MREKFIEIEHRLQAKEKLSKFNNNLYHAKSFKDRNKENRFSRKRDNSFNAIKDVRNFVTPIIKIIVITQIKESTSDN
jgi:hypothetical protein